MQCSQEFEIELTNSLTNQAYQTTRLVLADICGNELFVVADLLQTIDALLVDLGVYNKHNGITDIIVRHPSPEIYSFCITFPDVNVHAVAKLKGAGNENR